MAYEEYAKGRVYANEEEPQPEPSAKPPRKIADWALVLIALAALVLVVYYIGFGHINLSVSGGNNSNQSNQETPLPNQTLPIIVTGNISSIFYRGNTTVLSRQDLNLSLRIECSGACNALYVAVYDGTSLLTNYSYGSPWQNFMDVNLSVVVPKKDNAAWPVSLRADSNAAANILYNGTPDLKKDMTFTVLSHQQEIVYGTEFYLDVGEKANVTDQNISLELESIINGVATISATDQKGIKVSSHVSPSGPDNATFFDSVKVKLSNMSYLQVGLVAWPVGALDVVTLWPPNTQNVTLSQEFQVYLKCNGICAATYIGLYVETAENNTKIGFFNDSTAWSGEQTILVLVTLPDFCSGRMCNVTVQADTQDYLAAYNHYMLMNPPEKFLRQAYSVS
jgi:hypothetical protein